MAITDLPLFSMLRTRMHWHQERQRVLAENVANSSSPNYRPRDLAPPQFEAPRPARSGVALTQTAVGHFPGSIPAGSASRFQLARQAAHEVRPGGNAVVLEDEMMKVAANQMDYQAATTLYSRSLGLIKTAVGKR